MSSSIQPLGTLYMDSTWHSNLPIPTPKQHHVLHFNYTSPYLVTQSFLSVSSNTHPVVLSHPLANQTTRGLRNLYAELRFGSCSQRPSPRLERECGYTDGVSIATRERLMSTIYVNGKLRHRSCQIPQVFPPVVIN